MTKKLKVRTIDGKALYAQAGIYELTEPVASPLVAGGEWPVGTRFIIERHVDKIGDQCAYEYYSLRLAGNSKYLVRSYQHSNWNGAVSRLRMVADDLSTLIDEGQIAPLYILDQLERNGVVSREDIRQAIEDVYLVK